MFSFFSLEFVIELKKFSDWDKHPQYAQGTDEAKTFLAGSSKFQLDENEIEIYEKEWKLKLNTIKYFLFSIERY